MTPGSVFEAFGETKTVDQWVTDKRCRVERQTLLERLQEGWDSEFALVTIEREEPADVDDPDDLEAAFALASGGRRGTPESRMEQVRLAAREAATPEEIAGQIGITPAYVRMLIAEMADGNRIRALLEANKIGRRALQAAGDPLLNRIRALAEDCVSIHALATRVGIATRPLVDAIEAMPDGQRITELLEANRAASAPSAKEIAELRTQVGLAARVRGGTALDAPGRVAAVRRDEIVADWRSRAVGVDETARLAGVSVAAVKTWLDVESAMARAAMVAGVVQVSFTAPEQEVAELRQMIKLAAKYSSSGSAVERRDEIVAQWRLRGASVGEIAQLAGVTVAAVRRWLRPTPVSARTAVAPEARR